MLLKAIAEVKDANRPLPAAEMALVRLVHAADLPTPDDAVRMLQAAPQGGAGAATRPAGGSIAGSGPAAAMTQGAYPRSSGAANPSPRAAAPQTAPQPAANAAPAIATLEDIVALAARHRDIKLQTAIQRDLRLVSIKPGRLQVALAETGSRGIANELSGKLKEWTGQTWLVDMVQAEGQATLREQKQATERERKETAATHPAVKALMTAFPGARIVDVHSRSAVEASGHLEAAPDDMDAGLAASLESGEGLYHTAGDPYSDIEF
jgi:DNA polymerase-3 subunit gamma/tau